MKNLDKSDLFWQKYRFVNISIFRFLTSLGSGEVVCAIKGLVVEISHQTAAIKALEIKKVLSLKYIDP